MQLKPGLVGTATMDVGEEHTAARLKSGRAPVLATPILVALMEAAAVDCIEQLLPAGQESVGVRIEIEHSAPTPVGMRVTARAELKQIERRTLVFDVEAHDARERVGHGRHVRVLVDRDRFRAKVSAKCDEL